MRHTKNLNSNRFELGTTRVCRIGLLSMCTCNFILFPNNQLPFDYQGPGKRLQHMFQHPFDFVEWCWTTLTAEVGKQFQNIIQHLIQHQSQAAAVDVTVDTDMDTSLRDGVVRKLIRNITGTLRSTSATWMKASPQNVILRYRKSFATIPSRSRLQCGRSILKMNRYQRFQSKNR